MGEVHVLGIRHHGPGSARSLLKALAVIQPDCILIEGPPDADEVLALAGHPDMKPPVALLVYAPDEPKKAVFSPFAIFSPEWQAIQYALSHQLPVRFMDLPQTYQLAMARDKPPEETENGEEGEKEEIRFDPLGALAKAAGYQDGERWWEHMVEQRLDGTDLFDAILEAMTELRRTAEFPASAIGPHEDLREAYMRNTIRAAQKEGYQQIAVICGAWHGPALVDLPPASHDNALLKGLKKTKVNATWIPWTHGRLSVWTGYGAGVWSPGWYQHLWEVDGQAVAISWLTKVSHLLRGEDLDAATAQIIDAVRLAETLTALRDRPIPGLQELNEAALTVFCFGSEKPMQLIQHKLIIGEQMGEVPDETPTVPIQQDLQREQRRLRMRPQATKTTLSLDLRKPTHLESSHLLHRLQLLGVEWGKQEKMQGKQGTFHEVWQLLWQPELTIRLIEKSPFGNTIYDAASGFAVHTADTSPDLPTLTVLVNLLLLSDLSEVVVHVVQRLQEVAALTGDVRLLMAGVPPLADVLTYSNVRKTDASMVSDVIDGMVARIWIGLPGACAMLADDAAEEMFKTLLSFHSAVRLLQNPDHLASWHGVLQHLVKQENIHGLIAGRSCRILLDSQIVDDRETARLMRLALSTVNEPAQIAAWIDGFLRGSGLILLHDQTLLQILDEWVASLDENTFIALLPLLRRTFSSFHEPERRQIGEMIRGKGIKKRGRRGKNEDGPMIDQERANAVLPIIAQLLGLEMEQKA